MRRALVAGFSVVVAITITATCLLLLTIAVCIVSHLITWGLS